jgi:hypothetical protein
MKITKAKLRSIIREEVRRLTESDFDQIEKLINRLNRMDDPRSSSRAGLQFSRVVNRLIDAVKSAAQTADKREADEILDLLRNSMNVQGVGERMTKIFKNNM